LAGHSDRDRGGVVVFPCLGASRACTGGGRLSSAERRADKLARARMAKSVIQKGRRERAHVATAGEGAAGKERGDSSNSQASWPAHRPKRLFAAALAAPDAIPVAISDANLIDDQAIQRCPILAKPLVHGESMFRPEELNQSRCYDEGLRLLPMVARPPCDCSARRLRPKSRAAARSGGQRRARCGHNRWPAITISAGEIRSRRGAARPTRSIHPEARPT